MTAQEVEDYLARGGDTIFVGIGVVEVHGACPIDCEQLIPEAAALAMADEVDGLAMINLPYFYPGGTVISNATVHMSIRDGMDYLHKLTHSLVDQGFRRIYFVSGHGPSAMTLNGFCRDFFDETLIHVCHLGFLNLIVKAYGNEAAGNPSFLDDVLYGAYKMFGQLDFIPINPNATEDRGDRIPIDPAMKEFMDLYRPYAGYGATAQIFSDPRQHGGGRVFKSRRELEEVADKGIAQLKDLVSRLHLKEMNEALANYHTHVQKTADKYPRLRRKSL
jgi:creatinine amidohydrolase